MLSMPAHRAFSAYVTMGCLLLLGVQAAMNTSIAYCYLNEIVPTHLRSAVSVTWLAGEGCVQILHVLYYKYISKNWHWLIVYSACQSLIVLIVHLTFMPESPKWLYDRRRFRECIHVFDKMARFNGRHLVSGAQLLTQSMKQALEAEQERSDGSIEQDQAL